MKTRVFLVAVAAALIGAASASAQLRAGTVELNGFAGYLVGGHFGDAPGTDLYPFGYRLDIGDDLNYGGRIGYNFTSLFEIEFEYARTDTHLQIDPFHSDLPNIDFADFSIQYFMGYMTFNFGHGRGVPYFTIGGGAATFDPTFVGIATGSKTYGTAAIGGGYKYFFSPHFGLRADTRFYSTAVGSRTFYCGYGYYCTDTNWVTNFVVNGGVLIAF
jgi:Outer membrane protein beta-barrel domain